MRKASIISIGSEVLTGCRIDTNASYLGTMLLWVGLPVVSRYTVGDDVNSIVRALELAIGDADVVIATGGLGPTEDDLTRQAFAKVLGSKLELNNKVLQKMQDFFARRNSQMSDQNKIQAYIPAGADVLVNNIGTAAGIMAEFGGRLLFALPGVPAEMKKMFEDSVLEKLQKFAGGQKIVVRKLNCFGVGESDICELLGPVMQRGREPLISCIAENGVITLTITAVAEDEAVARQMTEQDERFLRDKLGKLVYGTGEQTLAEVVGEKLAQQKKTIAVAESCTGGTLAKLFTDVAGSSRYFAYGWVTYSNKAKSSQLGVPADLIEKHGAVSEQVAISMAEGARKKAGADCAIGITGIAGPDGASEQKPVGLIYISVACDSGGQCKRFILYGNRGSIRLRAALTALNMLRLKLQI